ncbi:MAG: TrmH family RNA methyltransferase [archaeon]
MEKTVGLLFDCLRAPYDIAHIVQVSLAIGNCDLYVSGNSIDFRHKKVVSKVRSWNINSYPSVEIFPDMGVASQELHGRDKYLIGTSPHSNKSLFDLDLSNGKNVFVFGTESGGLSRRKVSKLDEMVSIPSEVPFLTLPTAVSVVAYECYRQMRCKK